MNMIAMSGNFLGMVIAFYGSGLIGTSFGWESIFYSFGIIGIIWWSIWAFTIAGDPKNDKYCSKEEAEYISNSIGTKNDGTKIKHPWKDIFTSKAFWGIVAAHTAHNTAFYTIITLLPKYLKGKLTFEFLKKL